LGMVFIYLFQVREESFFRDGKKLALPRKRERARQVWLDNAYGAA